MMSDEQLEAIREVYKGAPDHNLPIRMLREIDELREALTTIEHETKISTIKYAVGLIEHEAEFEDEAIQLLEDWANSLRNRGPA